MRIVFFIGTLESGGKERRFIELLSYLKNHTNYDMIVVMRREKIEYPYFYKLNIPYKVITDNYKKKDISLPFNFFNICKKFKPDIIHTWGRMPAFVSLFTVLLSKIPHINSQITNAKPFRNKWSITNIVDKLNFRFSDLILSNSFAGLHTYTPPKHKSKVIYNGINMDRFKNLTEKSITRAKYGIKTNYVVIMVASFSTNKNFDLFINIAEKIIKKKKDISFVCVGDGTNFEKIKSRVNNNPYVILTGRITNVEDLVNASDIGILFSNEKIHGEGISNTILEYMALSKPVIANDAGGTSEIVKNGLNGYLISHEGPDEIANIITGLIEDKEKREEMGNAGRQLIENSFTIDKMGMDFKKAYNNILLHNGY